MIKTVIGSRSRVGYGAHTQQITRTANKICSFTRNSSEASTLSPHARAVWYDQPPTDDPEYVPQERCRPTGGAMTTTRREVLGVLCATGIGAIAGCRRTMLQSPGNTSTATPKPTSQSPEDTATTSPRTTLQSPEDTATATPRTTSQSPGGTLTATPRRAFPGGVFRCQGDPISVEQSLPDEEKPAAYFPSNDTVAYPALVSGDEIVEYDTMSFERWRVIQTAETAQGAVLTAVQNRVGTAVGTGLRRAPNADGPSLCVWLFVPDPEATEGTPPVTLHELVERAP